MTKLVINTCPMCGSKRIRRIKRAIESRRGGSVFVAQGVTVEECPDCGERLFGPEALEEIAAQKPRSQKNSRRRKSA
jgi:YgiT-type zinc finger domain-containing protein